MLHPWNRQSFSREYMIKCILTAKVPFTIAERPFASNVLSRFDKIFACHWIDDNSVITGGKDNKVCEFKYILAGQAKTLNLAIVVGY